MGDLEKDSSNGHVIDIPNQPWKLHRVPAQVRELQGKNNIYEPVLVSLGPYHHGHPRFKQVEDLKDEILRLLFPGSGSASLLREIKDQLGDVKSFYDDKLPSDDKVFDDEALAKMMLRDACFLMYCMTMMCTHDDVNCIVLDRLGMSRLAFVLRDFFMLENQLPFFILRKVISGLTQKQDEKAVDKSFYKLLASMLNCGDTCSTDDTLLFPKRGESSTLHLLDACRTILVEKMNSTSNAEVVAAQKAATAHSSCCGHNMQENTLHPLDSCSKILVKRMNSITTGEVVADHRATTATSQFRSVTDLKTKGIHFRPTKCNSYCLRDITFKSHSFYGMLRLPIVLLDNKSSVIFANIIAMEMSPGSRSDFAVTSYVKFMKSLIMKAEDVKELREKGILVSCLADDEEVVKMFRELNTEGSCRKDIFREIRERINEHCRSTTKTFKAELIHIYFRSPWTAIALMAAILILCVNCSNFFLNYYKFSHPRGANKE